MGNAQTGDAFAGGVLLPNGKVFCVPYSITTAAIYDPVTETVAIPAEKYPEWIGSFEGGVLMPNGKVFCVPSTYPTARIYSIINVYDSVELDMDFVLSPFNNKF